MGFHINDKKGNKAGNKNAKGAAPGGSSKFIPKANSKSAGPAKKPIKTGGARGS
jgi:hypothetical protein